MKLSMSIKIGCVISLMLLASSGEARQVRPFDFDWRFVLGDPPQASSFGYDDASWRMLDLPHDWSIEGGYDEANPGGIAMGFLPGGIGWYRKTFEWEPAWEGKLVSIEFDGVYMNSEVWINGQSLGKRPYGYISFGYDITSQLRPGKNVLAVRVDNAQVPSGRWYTGSGIYRHTRMIVADRVHVDKWGHYVTTSRDEASESHSVSVQTSIRSAATRAVNLRLETSIVDKEGKLVARDRRNVDMDAQSQTTLTPRLKVNAPALWSPGSPALYLVKTRILSRGRLLDACETRFGFRDFEFDPDRGFSLNGKPMKLKGLCMHHDAGPVGSAVPDDVLRLRLQMLKAMGCNAIRTSHNPFAPEFYDICDELGFLVMDEAFDGWNRAKAKHDYGNYFLKWWQRDLEDFIKRDRNHPSVIIWSIGNEVRGYTHEWQKRIVEFVKTLDPTRPVTQGRGHAGPHIDIAGFNGHGEFRGTFEKYRKQHPDRSIIGTEITHTLQTRGVYRSKTWYRVRDNPAPWEIGKTFASIEKRVYKIPDLCAEEIFPEEPRQYDSSYDNSIVRIGVRDEWMRVLDNDYYVGNFRWTGFDYLGESFGWPARTANFGIIDLAGIPKDHYYLYQSLWSDKPMLHLLPHWTHPGKEGTAIPIVAYSNCASVELFLNGQSLGRKKIDPREETVWMVPYVKGELKAVARIDGAVVAEHRVRTAGESSQIALQPSRLEMRANRSDVTRLDLEICDKHGSCVPLADNLVEFEIHGPGRLIGVENGDILDLTSNKGHNRRAFRGKLVAFVQSTDQAGAIEFVAKSKGLETRTVTIQVKSL
jgi:beta-galactosidase